MFLSIPVLFVMKQFDGTVVFIRQEMFNSLVDKQMVVCYRVKNVLETVVGFSF